MRLKYLTEYKRRKTILNNVQKVEKKAFKGFAEGRSKVMYEQSLYKVVKPIKLTTISRLNKAKKWEYGYNKEHDVVVISRTGQIGEIYEIQNFKIALPKSW